MKLELDRKSFASALKTAAVPTVSGHLAILGGLHLDASKDKLTCTGTNLDMTISVDLDAEVAKTGTVILPGRLLSALVDKAAADTVAITLDNDIATIEAGATVATLRTLPVADWPKVQTAAGKHFELTTTDVDRLGHVLHAVLTDSKKLASFPALGAVHFLGAQVQATDSYRMAIAELGCQDLPGACVPLDVVTRVVKACPGGLSVTFDDRSVTFDSAEGNITWTSRLIAAEYPKVEPLIRKTSPHELTVNRLALADALGRVRLLADGDLTDPVDLIRDGMYVRLSASQVDVGDICEEIPCTGDWDQPIRFHDRYLADLLANHDGDDITFEIEDALKTVQARTADWRLVLLVMPVRIS